MNRQNRWLMGLGIASLLLAAASLIARTVAVSNIPSLVLAVGSPYMPACAFVGLLVAVSCRRILLSVLAAVVVAVTPVAQVSWYYLGRPADIGPHEKIRVLSSNLRYGEANPDFIVNLARDNADVITVSELTPEAVERLQRSGIQESFPYSHLIPQSGAAGIGIWSRYPLDALSAVSHPDVVMPAARLQVPGLRFEPLLASVHVYSPVAGENNTVDEWRGGIASAKKQLDNFAELAGPASVIIGGDYNSTPDMRQFRDLLTNGYRDAVEQTGSGFAPTFPANEWFPPVITIDHVLTRNAAAESVRTITVPGSDHRALLVTVRVPLDPTAS